MFLFSNEQFTAAVVRNFLSLLYYKVHVQFIGGMGQHEGSNTARQRYMQGFIV